MTEEIIEKVYNLIVSHPLTGRAMEDTCTDGFEVKYVLLAKDITEKVIEMFTKEVIK